MKRNFLLFSFALLSASGYAQLNIQSGATFFIQSGATVTVQGDVTSNADIQGTGLLLLKGSSAQNVNMNGFTVNANIEIDNANHVTLTGIARASGLLTFTNGKLILGNNNFILAATGNFAGAATGRFAETNGTGQFRKEITANGNYILPVGTGTRYTPVQFNISGAGFAGAYVAGRAVNGGHPGKHPRSTDFLNQYWSLATNGVTGGTVTTIGSYTDATDVTGVEADIRSMAWNGSAWSMSGASQDNAANTVTAPLSGTSGDLYAMNRFVLVSPTVFLQGAFNSGTNLMNDLLRNNGAYVPGVLPASNLLPTSDPYRSAPYNTTFTHVANPTAETIASTVLNDQAVASQNIVDWVFLELRNTTSPGNTVLQTRSALVRRDGVIVDVDGISPIYFKNIDAQNYVVAVRHRNHLGLSIDPTTPVNLNLSSTSFNFTTAPDANINGNAGAAYTTINGFNLLWAGNANSNTTSRYQGTANDRATVLTDLGSNELSILNNVYHRADLNMNRNVRYQGSANDRAFLLSNVLASGELTIRTQVLPN
jgi:hypothetical protein